MCIVSTSEPLEQKSFRTFRYWHTRGLRMQAYEQVHTCTMPSSRWTPQKVGCCSETRLKVACEVQLGKAHSRCLLFTMPSDL